MTQPEKTIAIRRLNDDLRRTRAGGRIVLTCGVRVKGESTILLLLDKLRRFDDFDKENDPYHEHDFGQIVYDGQKYFFKIDYYDLSLQMHSPDAANPAVTCRVLTLMLAEEY